MRRYSIDDEARIHLQADVREWTRARLLDRAQGARLEAELRVDLRRTGPVLRTGLALFTALIVGASIGLLFTSFEIRGDAAVSLTTALAAVVCIAGAELLAGAFRLYRYGVEEMLSAAALAMLGISAATLVTAAAGPTHGEAAIVAALAAAAAASTAVYLRCGFLYAALGAMACAASIPFQLGLGRSMERLLAAAVLVSAFAAARSSHLRHKDDFTGEEYATLQAAALVGVYLVVNLYALSAPIDLVGFVRVESGPWFKWTTYVLTWVIPAFGLRLGILESDRRLIIASAAMGLATLVTSKPYLGWVHRPWDPMLFGILSSGVAIGVRRWLACGPGGERHGFTPGRLLERERDAIRFVGIASAVVQPASNAPAAVQPPSGLDGGRSGGAGGGAGF